MTTMPFTEEDAWKPCDLRGIYPDAVSPGLFRDIGGAVGSMLAPRSRVVVAGDFRLSTPELKRAVSNGLLEAGVNVLDAGQGPTPVAYFTARQTNAHAVLIVTASHNPAAHNGLKLMLGSVPISPRQLMEIRTLTESRRFRRGGRGAIETIDPRPLYMQTMLRRWEHLIGSGHGRVILDAGNGAWSEMAPAIFRDLGFDVTCLSCVADGRFPDRSPDCARASNLTRLRSMVREQTDSIGIAWDGDGDRAAFVDEAGDYVSPDEIAILFSHAVLEDKEPERSAERRIVVDVKCSDIVRRAILQRAGTPLLERTGHAFMRSRMVAEEALLGLDACGHYFFHELNGGDDGLFAAFFLLNLVRESGRSLRELRRVLPRIFSTPEIRIPTGLLPYTKASEALTSAFPEAGIVQIDGLRFVMEDGVVLIRESGTEPVLSLRIEGFASASHERILARCLQSLPEAAPQLRREALEASNY
jgi:phosphomannomutase / phosphoglucomutase